MAHSRQFFTCPVCGETGPIGAASCPECGACDKSGWSDEASYDGVDLPDEEFDYEQFAAKEFGGRAARSRVHWFWAIVAAAVLIAFALLAQRG